MKKLNLSHVEFQMLEENYDIIDKLYNITLLNHLKDLNFTGTTAVDFYRTNKSLRDLHRWLILNYYPYVNETDKYFYCKNIERILTKYLSNVKYSFNLEPVIDEMLTNLKNTY